MPFMFKYTEETWQSNQHGRWVDWLNDPRRNELRGELVAFVQDTHPGTFIDGPYTFRVATFKKELQNG